MIGMFSIEEHKTNRGVTYQISRVGHPDKYSIYLLFPLRYEVIFDQIY